MLFYLWLASILGGVHWEGFFFLLPFSSFSFVIFPGSLAYFLARRWRCFGPFGGACGEVGGEISQTEPQYGMTGVTSS